MTDYTVNVGDGGSTTTVSVSEIRDLFPGDTITFQNISLQPTMTIANIGGTVFSPSGDQTVTSTLTITVIDNSWDRSDWIGCSIAGRSQTGFNAFTAEAPPDKPVIDYAYSDQRWLYFKWYSAARADYYEVRTQKNSGGWSAPQNRGANLQTSYPDLDNGVWQVCVRAVNGSGDSGWVYSADIPITDNYSLSGTLESLYNQNPGKPGPTNHQFDSLSLSGMSAGFTANVTTTEMRTSETNTTDPAYFSTSKTYGNQTFYTLINPQEYGASKTGQLSVNGNLERTWYVETKPRPTPYPPSQPSASFSVTNNRISVSWGHGTNCDSYTLLVEYRSTATGAFTDSSTVNMGSGRSISWDNLNQGVRRYSVRGYNNELGEYSTYSSVSVEVNNILGTPSGGSVTIGYDPNQQILYWNNAANAYDHRIYYDSRPAGGSWSGQLYLDTGNNGSYDFSSIHNFDGDFVYSIKGRAKDGTQGPLYNVPQVTRQQPDSDPGSITGKLGNDIHDVVPSSYQYSAAFTVSGINTATTFSLVESPATGVDQSSVGASATLFASSANHGTSGYIQPNESIYVRITASSQYGKWTEFILTLDGNRSDVIRVYTQTYDSSPSGFTTIGADKENQQFGSEHTYLYTVSGINVPISATISNGELKVNNGSYQTGTINNIVNGDDLTIKVTAPLTYNATTTCTFDLAEMPRKTRSIGTPYDVQFSYTAPYTLANVNGFFGGGPTLDGSYYRGFAVPDIPGNENFPANGSISMSQFIGTRKRGEFLA